MSSPKCLLAAIVIGSILLVAPISEATECDVSTTVGGPSAVNPGEVATFSVTYANAGPDTATDAYVNLWLASGVPVRFDEMNQQQWDDLQASAEGTDTFGNTPMLFRDFDSCEDIFFQLQGPGPPDPIQPLDPGVSGSFTFDLPIPMDPPRVGTLIITHPPSLTQRYLPARTRNQRIYNSDGIRRIGRGVGCNWNGVTCYHYRDCFGPRLSYIDPIAADLELVDDGGGSGDPTLGCNPLVGFTPGRIALIRRGVCQFVEKANHAQDAGAVGIVIVNAFGCSGDGSIPHNDDCVLDMIAGVYPSGISIPAVFLSVNDGKSIIAELDAGGTVSAVMGAVPSDEFELSSDIFLWGGHDTDPNRFNDDDTLRVLHAIFADSFECGGCSAWSSTLRQIHRQANGGVPPFGIGSQGYERASAAQTRIVPLLKTEH